MHAYRDYTQLHTTRGKKRRKIKPHQPEVHGSCTFIAQAYVYVSSVCVYVCVSFFFVALWEALSVFRAHFHIRFEGSNVEGLYKQYRMQH